MFVLSMWWFPSKNICQKSSGSVLLNFWRSPLYWSLIFCKTYKFIYVICDVWCVMRNVWCSRLDFFVWSILYETRGDQRDPIWEISDLFNDIPKLIPGGSSMYTISCKASYISVPQQQNIFFSWMNRPSDDSSRRIIPVQFLEVLHTFKYFFLN